MHSRGQSGTVNGALKPESALPGRLWRRLAPKLANHKMAETASSLLTAWSNFYVMTGSSAAGLTGLMFVVITLVMRRDRTEDTHAGISTFSTPTVMHFAAALLISAVLIAPWRSLVHAGVVVAIVGLCGVAYIPRDAPDETTHHIHGVS